MTLISTGETPLKTIETSPELENAPESVAQTAQAQDIAETPVLAAAQAGADAGVTAGVEAGVAVAGESGGNSSLVLDEDGVRASLAKVIDPELHMNIVELGLIYKVDVLNQGGPVPDVEVEMTLTSPGCPFGPVILGQIPTKVKEDYGNRVGEINVSLTFTPPWDPATMASEDVQFELGIF